MPSTLKFCGRVSELEILKTRWALAANVKDPIPQVVVIKSEPGLGKTRLALEFYRWLRETHGWMTKCYWPEASQGINPNPHRCTFEVPIPFLWWGLQAEAQGDAVARYDRYLTPHLAQLLNAAHVEDRVLEAAKEGAMMALDVATSVFHVGRFFP